MPEKNISGQNLKSLSKTASELPQSGIRRFFDIASQMANVISLGVGEPDFATPWTVREAAIYSIEKGQTTYTSNLGLIELRREISKLNFKRYGVEYNPDTEILITTGVAQGLDLVARALLDPGDEVIIPEPCFVSYKPCVSLAGGIPVPVETNDTNNFQVSLAELEKKVTPRTKAILIGHPSNPTGAILERETLIEIVNFACKHGLYIISDEIYDRLTFDGDHVMVASLPGAFERTITLNGFSKTYAMTGWRIGYACAPPEILHTMMKIHSYTMLSAPTPGQKAALEAARRGERDAVLMAAEYKRRRSLIVGGLNEIGLTCLNPGGAFYAFPSVRSTGLTSEQFAEQLLYSKQVAVVPGSVFGLGGEGHVRCSYATDSKLLKEALVRIGSFVDELSKVSVQPQSPKQKTDQLV
ncbi:MAG: aminotransferase class I/II-fold pyridoxal phosphate-dependent enzyme [Candidatus Melainabacteria bacterium]|nr:aminotransferase class I/II-fold pyridoxal phosphate-dependent enzyme [Candidatus Melainabacteria bacterium]